MRLSFTEVNNEKNENASDSLEGKFLNVHVLASGSKGNATIIENTAINKAVLVDCGICKRDFFEGCAQVGVDPQVIEGILITHEHSDHTKGIGVVLRGMAKQGIHPMLYTSHAVKNASSEIIKIQDDFPIKYFKNEDALSLAGLEAQVFMTSHDAVESFGFRFTRNHFDSVGYLTDSGLVTEAAFDTLRDCRILALESNHDKHMLETGPYPYVLKKRVASDRGHLSNAQAAEALEQLLSTKLEQVLAMHISENNNTYRLPSEVLAEVLQRNDHPAHVHSAYQRRIVSVQ